jgi:hypothetical protein
MTISELISDPVPANLPPEYTRQVACFIRASVRDIASGAGGTACGAGFMVMVNPLQPLNARRNNAQQNSLIIGHIVTR